MKIIKVSLRFFIFFTLICGVIYPLLLTSFGKIFFPDKSQGSLIYKNGQLAGSMLIGQLYTDERLFHGRPSAGGYNPTPSKASHLPLGSEDLKKQVLARLSSESSPNQPPELLLASGSGLDPHISLEAALFQLERIVKTNNLNNEQKQAIIQKIQQLEEKPLFGLLGPGVVSVWQLNNFLATFHQNPNN